VDINDSFGKTAIKYADENDLKIIMKELLLTGLK
jgi:hypothetical protein